MEEIRIIPNVQTLLALLLIQPGRMYSRNSIASLLWAEFSEEQAHSCLNTALWRLRKILEPKGVPAGTYLISTSNGEVGFNFHSNHWVDVIEFERIIQHITNIEHTSASTDDIHRLEQAVALYNADLLEGCYYDWVIRERERLHLSYTEALYYLLNFHKCHNEYAKAIRWGQQILLLDPLREDVHRSLMRLYAENGQRALAVRQYRYCQSILETELGIEPMPDTRMVYYKVLGRQLAEIPRAEDSAQIDETMASLHSAMDSIRRAQQDLQEALARLDK